MQTFNKPEVTAEQFREWYDYNAATGDITTKSRHWGSTVPIGTKISYTGKNGYVFMTCGKVRTGAHRFVWLYVTGEWPSFEIDHINGNRADNRWANLRPATRSQQLHNLHNLKPNKWGCPGVYKRGPSWRAKIKISGKAVNLGTFATPELASAAYRAAKDKLHA